MAFLRGAKKLIVGVGLASCGAAAAAAIFNLHDSTKAQAASALEAPSPWEWDRLCSSAGGHSAFKTHKWDFNWDRREPESLVRPLRGHFSDTDQNDHNTKLESARSRATRHLILVRHGQYNMRGETDLDRQLTPLGREQAALTGARLLELELPLTRIIQSTMTRAMETTSIIRKHLPDSIPLESCDFLREGAPTPPEPPVGHWKPEPKQYHQDGARIETAFRKYFHRADPTQERDSYELLVCHANVIRYFICRALQFPAEAWLRFSLHNCSLTWIAIRPSGRVVVYSVGDIGHVPGAKMTTS